MTYTGVNIEGLEDTDLRTFIISSVKEIVFKYDPNATVTLFGSRARGDFHEESDWDFLVTTDFDERDETLKDQVRKEILYKVEFTTFQHVATIFHNKKVWNEDYGITNLFESIAEEGIVV